MQDFGKAQYETIKAIDNARTNAILTIDKQNNVPIEQTIKKLYTQKEYDTLCKTIKVFAVMTALYNLISSIDTDVSKWKALDGYAYIVQGYVEHPQALEFSEFLDESKTVKGVLDLILDKEDMTLEQYLEDVPQPKQSKLIETFDTEILSFLNINFA